MTAVNSTPFTHSAAAKRAPSPVACFSVHAESDPGSLPKVLEPFAKRGLVPRQVHVTRETGLSGSEAGGLQIDLQMTGMDLETATTIGRSLNAIFGIHSVLVSEKVSG